MGKEKFRRLWKLERRCCSCGRKIYYRGFYKKACFWNVPNGLEREMIEEIWENPIFVLECCYCFAGLTREIMPASIRQSINQLERLAKEIRKIREKRLCLH